MRRFLIGSAIAASLLLTSCAAASEAEPEAAPVVDRLSIQAPSPAAQASTPAPSLSPNSPDPSAIRVVPQPVDGADPIRAEIAGLGGIEVLPVGVTDDGQAEIPADVSRVGWYKYGSAPGDGDGSVVLMGHRDGVGLKGALFDLPNVAVGSTIVVNDAAGVSHTYRVERNESISKQVVPLADLFQRDGPPRLIIISCGGEYIKAQGGYLDNVVVTAAPV
jgi:hypothetical protein